MGIITILVLVIAVTIILVTIFLLLLRRSNARPTSRRDSRGEVTWHRSEYQSGSDQQYLQNPNPPEDNSWAQTGQQQANTWDAQQQAAAWGAQNAPQYQGSSGAQNPAQQQPAAWGAQPPPPAWDAQNAPQQQAGGWGAQSGQQQADAWGSPATSPSGTGGQQSWGAAPAEASQDPWAQQQNVPAWSQQNNPQAPATFSGGSGQSWGQSAPAADPWGQPTQQQTASEDPAIATGALSPRPPVLPPGLPVERATTQDKTDVRYSDVSFPRHTVVGRIEALRVAITRKAVNPWAVPLALERLPGDSQPMEVDAYVVVSPLDFDLEGSNIQTITVFPNADSTPVLFKLVVKSEGRKTIAVEFFQNARYLGRAELETTTSQQEQLSRLVSAQAMLEMRATQLPPDLTILFDRVPVGNDRHYYRYRLLSPIRELNLWFEEFRSPETNIMPQGFLEETFTQLNRMFSGDTPSEFFFGRLNSIGMSLYRRLFSDDFKRLYWNSLRNKVKSIVIISFEPWIPWELVRPFNPETNEAEDGFLCEKYNLTRWLAGAGFPDIMSLEQLGLIVSTSNLDSAKLEAEEIKQLLGTKVRDIVSSGPSLYHLLRTNDFYGLHFACHGSFNKDNPDMSTLSLEDGTWLSPIDIDGDGLAFGKKKPLVFLNACETGQSGYALTGMGGWAEAFVGRAKCSGFIGSIWKANDESACKFAVAFYRYFLDGKTVAEAARLARLSIKQAGDPTWLSYTVYANPLAHLVIESSLQRENPIVLPKE